MLERPVMIDGAVYVSHELIRLMCKKGSGMSATVRSFGPESDDPRMECESDHSLPWDADMTFSMAEEATWALPDFEEYVDSTELLDEILSILTDEQAATVPDAFREWKPDTDYAVGDRRRHAGILYKCLQAHKSVEGQTPDVAVSLWANILNPDPEVIPVWEQPDSTNPYMKGDRVHFPDADGPVYESIQDYNVFAPDVAGWVLVEGGE